MKYKTGDILVERDSLLRVKVLGVCGQVVFLSSKSDFDELAFSATEKRIDEDYAIKFRHPADGKVSVEWNPESGDKYFFVTSFGKVEFLFWEDCTRGQFQLATKNCFRTREEAEARLSEIKKEAGLI